MFGLFKESLKQPKALESFFQYSNFINLLSINLGPILLCLLQQK